MEGQNLLLASSHNLLKIPNKIITRAAWSWDAEFFSDLCRVAFLYDLTALPRKTLSHLFF